MLREEFLVPLGTTAAETAKRIHVAAPIIENLVEERGEITPDLALRLARLFGTSAEFWLNGQLAWDLYHAMRAPEAAGIDVIAPLFATAPDTEGNE
jgi:antitoxin HigA-1